ncbi:MAG: hypothetical protein MZW92_21415 [Comamonadaceae bacterium]|nr:hypothetical protein [Comamonadaceae bacterium]
MKLHYYRDPKGNFGDDLNPWLWPKLLPGVLDEDESELLVGIGTLLNHRLPVGQVKPVLGSGVGYGGLPAHDGRLRFHALRGYLSADRLGVEPDQVITDAAVLLRLVDVPAARGAAGPGRADADRAGAERLRLAARLRRGRRRADQPATGRSSA